MSIFNSGEKKHVDAVAHLSQSRRKKKRQAWKGQQVEGRKRIVSMWGVESDDRASINGKASRKIHVLSGDSNG